MYYGAMTFQSEAIEALSKSGVLDGIIWAARSACARTLADYSEATGHDATWLGQTRYILFKDRLDRAFSLGKYYLSEGADEGAGKDFLFAELTVTDIESFPDVGAGRVKRADINNSPGWTDGAYPFLLQSFKPGRINSIGWAGISPTKERVASQEDPDKIYLFEAPADDNEEVITVPIGDPVLVVAHALDPITGEVELYVGLPSLERDRNAPWHWLHPLLGGPPDKLRVEMPRNGDQNKIKVVDDAPVKLRVQEQKFRNA